MTSSKDDTRKMSEVRMEYQLPAEKDLKLNNINNNNRHVVTFGIVAVFFTLYLTVTSIHHLSDEIEFDNPRNDKGILEYIRKDQRQISILEKLLEHEHICHELEIFITKFQQNEKLTSPARENDLSKSENKRSHEVIKNNLANSEESSKISDDTKKDRIKKKNSTAEPIIYLFALVFIYLLLKAASDINQHYKLQAKGDKRLRRCSLQSYAQTHKQDRRSPKDKPPNGINQKHHFRAQRSLSFERLQMLKMENFNYQQDDFNISLQKNGSADAELGNESQKYHHLCNGNILERVAYNATNVLFTDLHTPSRRCSVPVLLSSQKTLATSNAPDLNRRTSVYCGRKIGLLPSSCESVENVDIQFGGNKRRVRMINRH